MTHSPASGTPDDRRWLSQPHAHPGFRGDHEAWAVFYLNPSGELLGLPLLEARVIRLLGIHG